MQFSDGEEEVCSTARQIVVFTHFSISLDFWFKLVVAELQLCQEGILAGFVIKGMEHVVEVAGHSDVKLTTENKVFNELMP